MILQTNYKMKPPPSAKPIKSILKKLGCLGLWVMNENGGLTVFDLSGNGFHGTIVCTSPWSSGKFGSAIYCDGVDDYISFPKAVIQQSTWTVVVWVKCKVSPIYHGYIFADSTDAANLLVRVYLIDDRYNSYIGDVDGGSFDIAGSFGKWQQLVVTHDATGNVNIFLDNILRDTLVGSNFTGLTGDLWLGNRVGLDRDFQGYFDNMLICNRVLTAQERDLIYREPFYMFGRKRQPVITAAAPPPEVACQFASLTTNLWWLKHSKGLYTEL